MRGAPGLRYVFSPSQHAKERREMLLIMTEGGVLVRPSQGQFKTVPNATFLIFAKGCLYGTRRCEKCLERDASRKGHVTGPRGRPPRYSIRYPVLIFKQRRIFLRILGLCDSFTNTVLQRHSLHMKIPKL